MTRWRYDNMTRWRDYKMTRWRDDEMTRWQDDEMTRRRDDKMSGGLVAVVKISSNITVRHMCYESEQKM